MKRLLQLTALLIFSFCYSQTTENILENGNFHNCNEAWELGGNFYWTYDCTGFYTQHNFSYGYMYNTQDNNAFDTISQEMDFPANATDIELELYHKISTEETDNNTAYDFLTIELVSNSETYEVDVLSNKDLSSNYVQKTYDIPTGLFDNESIEIIFTVDNDGAKPTRFRVDDISLNVTFDDSGSNDLPDLVVINETVSDNTVDVGDEINASCTIKNDGDAQGGSSRTYYVFSSDDLFSNDDIVLEDESSNTLDPNEIDNEDRDVVIPDVPPGQYYILFITDAEYEVVESDEDNNVASVPITINGNNCEGVTITQQPANQSVPSGSSASFFVSATGTTPITYQWKKNGSNISGATSSSYTTPALNLSDNGNIYFCEITNCDGTVSSNNATVSVQNNFPPDLTIETTNSTFSNDKILFSGTSNPNYIKVCADGTKSTRFTLINNSGISNENIGFSIVPDNSDISVYGVFDNNDIEIIGANTIEALYTHPTTFPNSADFNESRSIEIYDTSNPSNILFSIPLRIYKAPVLMVHGLWGNASGFEIMEDFLLNVGYNSTLIKKANYCMTAGNSFSQNSWVVPNNIISLLDQCRMHNFSTGKVDVVSHSMGGVLSRVYLQSHSIQYVENINRLITLNTPHSGSPLGNLALNPDIDSFTMSINEILNDGYIFQCDPSITDGAVYDLAIDSPAMNQLNQTYLNNNIVPVHTVVTKLNLSSTAGYFINSIAEILVPELEPNENEDGFIVNLFDADEHDLVVSMNSQQGGLTGNSTQLMNGQIWHIGSQEKTEVISHVSFLLQQNPNSSYFEQNGFSPATITSNYRVSQSTSSNNNIENDSELIPNSIFINTPIDNSSFNVGEVMDVNVTSSNGINRIVLYVIDKFNDNYSKEEFLSSSVNTQYSIINDTYENISLLALGFNDSGLVDYEFKTIGVDSNIDIIGIEFLNDEIHIQKDFISPVSINLVYSNGDRKLLTNLSDIQLTINDNTVAEQYNLNYLKGNDYGETTLSADYLGYSISTPVVVYESNVEMPDLETLSNEEIEINQINPSDSLTIIPNPNNGTFTLQFNALPNENHTINIYDSLGKRVVEMEVESNDNNFSKEISLNGLANGLYYIKVSSNSKQNVGKIIINRN